MKGRKILYKISVSIVLGLAGFLINFYPINFEFPNHRASFMLGLVFPMVVTLAWGWRYGLLSATLGMGCQTMWFLWFSGGWGPVVAVPPFTLWIVWHGWCSERYRSHRLTRSDPYLNPYLVEIPFRIFNTILLYTVFRWAFQFNPPPWNVSALSRSIPLPVVNFMVVKEAANGYTVLLVADVLLNLGAVRGFLKLKERPDQTSTTYITSASILLGCLFWVFSSVLDYLAFYAGQGTLLELAVLKVPPHELFVRTAFLLACLMGGLLSSKFLRKQREVEETLRQREKRLSAVLDNATIHVWAFDGEWYPYLSKEWYRYTGQDPALPRTIKRWTEVVHPDDLDKAVITWFKAWDSKGVYDDNFRLKSAKGGYRLFHSHAVPIYDENGKFQHYQGYNIDITERVRAEAEREALITELETKNAELERFTYTVSHDLKSPLITIKGFLGLLERDAIAGNVERAKTDIARISNAADKMQHLLDDLLELSRIGRLVSPPEEVPLGELAREAVNMVAGRLEKRGIEVEIAPDLLTVYGDRPRLREVLENLVDNAVKFMGDQASPRVEIGVRRDKDESKTEGEGETVFYVRDNGMGIDPRYHEKVFGLFEQLDQETEGTGVGLAIVKRTVEVHGGRIWVESEGIGKGSTFCFTLPDKK